MLMKHLASVSSLCKLPEKAGEPYVNKNRESNKILNLHLISEDLASRVFSTIVRLKTGEALMFAPSAILGVQKGAVAPFTGGSKCSEAEHRRPNVSPGDFKSTHP